MPVIQAFAEGKTIQIWSVDFQQWVDLGSPDFTDPSGTCCPPNSYRVKPEKKWRAWKTEEVQVGCLLDNGVGWVGILMAVNRKTGQCLVFHGVNPTWESIQEVWETYTHSLDGGKTWQPCGVEEEAK